MTAAVGPTEPTVRGQQAMGAIARGGLANLVGSGISALGQFVVVFAATRFYPQAQAGALFTATVSFLIVAALAQLGADQGLTRFVAWHRARGEPDAVRRVIRAALPAVLIAGLAGAAMLGGLSSLVARLFTTETADLVSAMLRVLALAVPFAALNDVLLAATRGFGTMRPTVVIERILRPTLQPVLVVAVGVLDADPLLLAGAWAAPYVLTSGLAAWSLRRRLRRLGPGSTSHGMAGGEVANDASSARSSRGLVRDFWTFAGTRGVARGFQVALQRVDVIIVAAMLGTAAAAVYTAATRFIAIGQLANQAVQQVIQPRLAELLARGEHPSAEHVVRQSTLWLTALAWPGYLALVVLAGPLMSIFGPEYVDGASSVAVLAVAMMLATAVGPVDVVLLMAGRSSASLGCLIVALVTDVALCLALLPRMGVLGAAVAWAASILARNALTVVLARRMVGISAWSGELGRLSVAAIASIGLVPGILAATGQPGWSVVVALVVGSGGYVWWLWRRRDSLGLPALVSAARRVPTSVTA